MRYNKMSIITKYQQAITKQQNENIKARAGLGLPLTAHERAKYLLFLATVEQAKQFLQMEKLKK